MAIHSGKFGAINGQRSISQWQISKNLASTPFTLSNTKGARGRSNGIKEWSGSCQQMLGEPTVLPGATFSFIGYQAPDNDISGAGAGGYSGTAMVQQVQINWDWRSGNPLSSNITFLGDGALTGPATQTITDTGQVDILPVCACKIESSTNGSVWTELADVASAQLTLTSEVLSYVNSSTQCWRKRKAGIKDWSASIVIDTDLEPLTPGTDYYFRFYTTATLFWLLKYGKVTDYTNINVNIQSGEIISKTMNIVANPYITPSTTDGTVTTPSVTEWWSGD